MSQLLLLHYIEVSLLECLLKGEEIIKCHNDTVIIILKIIVSYKPSNGTVNKVISVILLNTVRYPAS